MTEITTVGVDLAKEVIVVCAGDRIGRPVFSRQFSFHGFAQWAAMLSKATFGLEACSSAHHWARWLTERGHVARLTAVLQPTMRFVSVKSVDSQAMLAVHTMRRGWEAERTALLNRTRGLLAEFGIWLGRSSARLLRALPELTETDTLPAPVRILLRQVREQITALEQQIDACERQIAEHAKHSDDAQRLQAVTGIGTITPEQVRATRASGMRYKLICSAERTANGVRATVRPEQLPMTDPLALLEGPTSALRFEMDVFGLSIIEHKAHVIATAYGLLGDFIRAVQP